MPVLRPRMTFKAIASETHQKPSVAVTQCVNSINAYCLAGLSLTLAGPFLCLHFLQLTFNPYEQDANRSTSQVALFEALEMRQRTPC